MIQQDDFGDITHKDRHTHVVIIVLDYGLLLDDDL